MPDFNSLLVFIGAGLLLNITPGPDVLYIVGRSIGQGRVAGLVSVLGISTGCLFHVASAALGLSALMLALPLAYDVVRYAGPLIWYGSGCERWAANRRRFRCNDLSPRNRWTNHRICRSTRRPRHSLD